MQVSFGSWPSNNGLERMRPELLGRVLSDATVSELDQIEPINEHIYGANRIAIVDPIIEAFRPPHAKNLRGGNGMPTFGDIERWLSCQARHSLESLIGLSGSGCLIADY